MEGYREQAKVFSLPAQDFTSTSSELVPYFPIFSLTESHVPLEWHVSRKLKHI